MRSELVDAGWTDEHWNRIVGVVKDEVQKARVAAQFLPTIGPLDDSAVAFAEFRRTYGASNMPIQPPSPQDRIDTFDPPIHPLTNVAVPVQLTSAELADPELGAALNKFRRAANILARLEDAIVFNDRLAAGAPLGGIAGTPQVFQVTAGGPAPGDNVELGLLPLDLGLGIGPAPNFAGIPALITPVQPRQFVQVSPLVPMLPNGAFVPPYPIPATTEVGEGVVQAIIQAMNLLEDSGQSAPFACALSPYFYEAVYVPNGNFVAAKDRILPILNGPLVRSSAIIDTHPFGERIPYGVVIALGGEPVGLRVAVDVGVKFVQITEEPRYLFRVSERIGLRVSDPQAIVVLTP